MRFRVVPPVLLVLVVSTYFPAYSQQAKTAETVREAEQIARTSQHSVSAAATITRFTSIAFCPILGVAMVGGWTYYVTPPVLRPALPWYFQGWAIAVCAILALTFLMKSSALQLAPVLKKPLDAVAGLANFVSGLVLCIPLLHDSALELGQSRFGEMLSGSGLIAYAADGNTSPEGETGWLTIGVFMALGVVIYWSVWLVGNLINALILVNPIPFLDVLLVLLAVGVFGVLAVSYWLHPLVGLTVSLSLVFVALISSAWTLRFTIFTTLFSFDLALWRRDLSWNREGMFKVFTGAGLKRVPRRTFGTVIVGDGGGHLFTYRRWFFGPKRILRIERSALEIGNSITHACLIRRSQNGKGYAVVLRFMPRYHGQESAIARAFQTQCNDIGIRRGLKGIKSWAKEQLQVARNLRRESATA